MSENEITPVYTTLDIVDNYIIVMGSYVMMSNDFETWMPQTYFVYENEPVTGFLYKNNTIFLMKDTKRKK